MTIVVPAASTTGVGPTLAAYVSALGDQLGTYAEYTVSTTATGSDLTRLVLADELRDDEPDAEDWGERLYVYARSGVQAGAQRRVLRDGYEGPLGGLILSRPWASALQAGSTIAVTEPLPVRRHRNTKGLVTLVNEALARIWVETFVDVTGTGTYQYDLAAYPWLQFGLVQSGGLYDALGFTSGLPTLLSPYDYDIRANGAGRTLITHRLYGTADSFQIKALVRADVLISDGLSWNYTTSPGLTNDTDQAAAPVGWVVPIAMVKGLQYLTRLFLSDRSMSQEERRARLGEIEQRRRTWALAAATLVRDEFPKLAPVPGRALVGGTTSSDGIVERVSSWA